MHEGSGPCSSSEVMLSTMHFKAGMDFKMSRCVCVSVCVCVCVCVCISCNKVKNIKFCPVRVIKK